MPASVHVSVLLEEVIGGLEIESGQFVVDGTFGGGGHSRRMAELVGPQGLVLGMDRDPAALSLEGLEDLSPPLRLVHANFCDLAEVVHELELPKVDRALLDLGLSSDQLADRERGFSFDADGDLDMRFDTSEGEPAWELVQRLNAEKLANLIYEFGEERRSRRIARAIVEARRREPIRTPRQLANIVHGCMPRGRIDSATRTFQALRIAVNGELESLDKALASFADILAPGGRIAVISFHSLEDRRVKYAFRDDERYKVLTKKPIRPNQIEMQRNPRSRSAKLRIAARV